MELKKLKENIEEKLNKQISSKIFLDHMRVLNEDSRKSLPYNDPTYVPFYYWLGKFIETNPKSLLEIGLRLGLFSGTFLKSCKTIETFLGFQEKTEEFYSYKLAKANVRDNFKGDLDLYVGDIKDESFETLLSKNKWDVVIINEEKGYDTHREYFDVIWSKLNFGGLIIIDYVKRHKAAREAYRDFCKIKNKEPVEINTRYGVGIISKT